MNQNQMKPDTELTWTTWEELLLTCAVERHGVKDWESVAMELQSRSALSLLLTARACETKYHDLKRRFVAGNDDVDAIPWVEELRKLRVAELKQEVLRYDLSIQSLESKVKRLEEERERSLKDDQNDGVKPDLEKNLEGERSENDRDDGAGAPEESSPEIAGSENSDRENRSFNESNSTGNRGKEPEPVETVGVKLDPVSSGSKPTGEDSYNNSSDTVAKRAAAKASQERRSKKKPSQEMKGGDSAELRNTEGESKEGLKESSDVQSTANLTRRRRREKEVSGCGGGSDVPVVSPATIKREVVKSEPLVAILDIIRSHKHGSMFERRLKSQKTEEYKNTVRHHVDLDTIRTRLKNGSYSSSSTTKFHRDLLLLFTNATVFFPKTSTESIAAHQLRDFVLEEIKKTNNTKTQRPDSPDPPPVQPKPDPEGSDSFLSKQKSTAPIVVCGKRSSISAKRSNTQIDEKPNLNVKNSPKMKEEESPTKVKMRESAVTGARSLRGNRNTQMIENPNSNNGSMQKGETDTKINKKEKAEATSLKKRGAADFLKRIKRNSPAKGATMVETVKSEGNNGGGGRRETKKRGDGGKGAPALKRGGGGKAVKEESPPKRGVGRPAKRGGEAGERKRGREGGGAEAPKKRSKR
ncbi:Bromodomain-containing protein [Actinidia chinensis var. chinensis]|uniref:Bromodomain-containing protein n=1 Tax=Actinidia chinensis var. chinensis TaxID=1590841 RepID=A0A2R6QPW9_ACTCC|nr:Bromodomain-containing protein [Actinidia chinensis var. chinensis]